MNRHTREPTLARGRLCENTKCGVTPLQAPSARASSTGVERNGMAMSAHDKPRDPKRATGAEETQKRHASTRPSTTTTAKRSSGENLKVTEWGIENPEDSAKAQPKATSKATTKAATTTTPKAATRATTKAKAKASAPKAPDVTHETVTDWGVANPDAKGS